LEVLDRPQEGHPASEKTTVEFTTMNKCQGWDSEKTTVKTGKNWQ